MVVKWEKEKIKITVKITIPEFSQFSKSSIKRKEQRKAAQRKSET
jgi:hypothetical protein